MTIRVLLADDQPLLRGGFAVLIGSAPDLEVVGEAATGREAVELARSSRADVVLMDIDMPGMNGIELYDRLHLNRELAPIPAILITANRYIPQLQIRQRQLITFMKPFELDSFLDTIETLLAS